MRARGWLVSALLAVAALLLLGRTLTSLVVDHEWFEALDLGSLWWEKASATLVLQGGLALIGTLFAFVNFSAVRSTILAVAVPQRVGNIELTAMIPGQRLVWLTALFALLVGCALAVPFDDWTLVSLARHGVPFGEIEGYHNRDLGFYVYWLPLEETLYLWALASIVAMTALVMVLYALTRSLRVEGRRIIASSHVRRHMSALGALVLLLLAWSYRLDSFELLREGSGPEGLFMRVDHVVTLRVDVGLAVLAAVASLLLLRAGWQGQRRAAMAIIGGMLIAAAALRHGLPALLARGDTIGEPARRDADYLATRALVSRRAYDSDGVRMAEGDTLVDTRIALDAVGRRVSLWDAAAISRATTDATTPPGAAPATTLTPAVVATEQGTVGMLDVRAGAAGDPWRVLVRDLATPSLASHEIDWHAAPDSAADAPLMPGGEPLVAPGLRGHVVVYDHTGRVPGTLLDSFLSRLAHAWSTRDPSLLTRDSLAPPLVYVPHRDVRQRVAQLAPIFAQGTDVLPLVHERTLYWTLDLYSASIDYPLSQRWLLAGDVRSYFRHAGTALVDAMTGVVRIVMVQRPDPIARTWMAVVPDLWIAPDELPVSLVEALPPATDGAMAQLRTMARHGSRIEGQVPRTFPDSVLAFDRLTPVLVTVDRTLVPAWTAPLLDAREQLGGVATAVGGSVRTTFWDTTSVPRQSWPAIAEQLRGALDSARTGVPQGSRREPRVQFSRIHAVMTPVAPLFTQAVHLSSGDGASPIVQVALSMGDRVVVGRDLFAASSELLGSAVMPPTPLQTTPPDDREVLTIRLYDSMREALRRADWVRFGAAFDSLGRLLGRPPQ